jgi:hypothetical protein
MMVALILASIFFDAARSAVLRAAVPGSLGSGSPATGVKEIDQTNALNAEFLGGNPPV